MRQSDDPLGNRSDQHMCYPSPAMRGHDDKVGLQGVGQLHNLVSRIPFADVQLQ